LRQLRSRFSLDELGIARVDWPDLGPDFLRAWGRPGGRVEPEHLTVYGKTRSGKTYFVREILRLRALLRGSHIVIVATKRADRTLTSMGWPIVTAYPAPYGQDQVIFWARAKGLSAVHRAPQRVKVKKFMDTIWTPDSNVVIYWDELTYIQDVLKLGPELETIYREGAGNGITNVASMQRPTRVTRLSHSEAAWTVAFPPKDVDDRNRVAEVLGDRARFSAALDGLDRRQHDFLLRHDRTGQVYVTHLPDPRIQRVGSARRRR
jgi:hypothetical protein